MNELVSNEKIENMIYEFREKQVMLDSDLAKLYQCKNGTKEINQAVKNNIDKFPKRFSWVLSDEEYGELKSKFLTSRIENSKRGGRRNKPRVFTEQGVAMLATILKSKTSSEVSIQIMDAFVAMRCYISNSLLNQEKINKQVIKNTDNIKIIQKMLNNFEIKNNHIFFEGQIYDAYSLLLDIFNLSKESITIIDNYADKKLLDILSKTKKRIKIYSKNINGELIKKYQSQYDNVELIENDTFHDRFIIIDNKYLYHCGAPFKELGKKCFAINKIEDKNWLKELIEYLK